MTEYPTIRRDGEANAAYLALGPIAGGAAVKSVPVEDDNGATLLVIDFSAQGQVLGIEFLDAATQLSGIPAE